MNGKRALDRARGRGPLALALALALLLPAWIARAGHMLFVTHALCATHGELVHGDHDPSHEARAADAALSADRHDDGHHHCDALGQSEAMSTPAPGRAPELLPAFARDDRSTGRRVPPSRHSLLLRAPKTSPPA